MKRLILFGVLLCALIVVSHFASSKVWAGEALGLTGGSADMDYLNRPHFRFHGDIEEAKTLYVQAWHYLQNMKQSVAPGFGVQGPFRRIFDDGTEFLVQCVAGVDLIEIFVPEQAPVARKEVPEDQILYYYRFQLRYIDESIVDPRGLPHDEIKKVSDSSSWDVLMPDGGDDHFGIEPVLLPVDNEWNEGFYTHSWDGVLLLNFVSAPDFAKNVLLKGGAYWALSRAIHGDDAKYLFSYNIYDKHIYIFFAPSDVDKDFRDIINKANLLIEVFYMPYSDSAYYNLFDSMLAYAPTELAEDPTEWASILKPEAKFNNREYLYYEPFVGTQGRPSQDREEMALFPGSSEWPPQHEHIVYLPDIPQDLNDPTHWAEDLDKIKHGDGEASFVWEVRTETFFRAAYEFDVTDRYFYLHSKPLGSEHLGEHGTWFPEDPDVDGDPVNFDLTISVGDKVIFTGTSEDGYLELDHDHPNYETGGLRKDAGCGEHRLTMKITVSRHRDPIPGAGEDFHLYATYKKPWGNMWWCSVDSISCCDDDVRGVLGNFRIGGDSAQGKEICF